MPQLARNLIDAIQNTLLDGLFFRVLNMLFATLSATLLYGIGPMHIHAAVILIPTYAGVVFIAWLLGVLANRLPRPATTAFERLQQPRSNGFEAWQDPPAGGLNPTPRLRRFIAVLSQAKPRLYPPCLIVWIIGMLALYTLSFSSPEWRAADGTWLVRHTSLIFSSVVALGLLLALLAWADESSRRLTAPPQIRTPA